MVAVDLWAGINVTAYRTFFLISVTDGGQSKLEWFRIDATYEMRTTEYGEICISIDNQTIAERAFKQNGKMGKESKVVERQREIECVCENVDWNQW